MVTLVFHAGKDAGDGWPEPAVASARAACGVRCVRRDWMRERGRGISSAYTLSRRQIVQLVFQCTGRESRHSGAVAGRCLSGNSLERALEPSKWPDQACMQAAGAMQSCRRVFHRGSNRARVLAPGGQDRRFRRGKARSRRGAPLPSKDLGSTEEDELGLGEGRRQPAHAG